METPKLIPKEHIYWVVDTIKSFIRIVKDTTWDILTIRDLQDNLNNVRDSARRLR